eukprot:scaffold77712_cov87-Phaeocystis_antarctica.AAC.1
MAPQPTRLPRTRAKWEPSPIGGAGDREVYSAVFSRVLEAVIAHSTERPCVFAFVITLVV